MNNCPNQLFPSICIGMRNKTCNWSLYAIFYEYPYLSSKSRQRPEFLWPCYNGHCAFTGRKIKVIGEYFAQQDFSFNLRVVRYSMRFLANTNNLLLSGCIDPNFYVQATVAIVLVLVAYKTEWTPFAQTEFFAQFSWGCSKTKLVVVNRWICIFKYCKYSELNIVCDYGNYHVYWNILNNFSLQLSGGTVEHLLLIFVI